MQMTFLILVGLLVYGYALYPLGLCIGAFFKKRSLDTLALEGLKDEAVPLVTVVVAAHNEERAITTRLENIFDSHYPNEKLEVIVASDGSTDRTVELASLFAAQHVKVLDFKMKRGRAKVHNDAVEYASGEILFFTDAETEFDRDCIRNMVIHYQDPLVGCVGGRLVAKNFEGKSLGMGQKLYWQLEYMLRNTQSTLGVLTKASGANMSIRRALYREVPLDSDVDMVAAPDVVLQGYRVVHEEDAIAYESFAVDIARQLLTRQRFVIQTLSALKHHWALLNPFAHPVLSLHVISYRLLRYVTPFLLVAILLVNIFLARDGFYLAAILILQILVYSLAAVGCVLELRQSKVKSKLFSIPFSFFCFELGILLGCIRFAVGKTIVSYSKNE